MKPETMPQDEYETRLQQAKDGLRGGPNAWMAFHPKTVEVVAAGNQLEELMKAEGASDEDARDTCFAFGQACFPDREPWKTGAAILTRWREGRAPKPGVAFADELLTGDRANIADLPPGGLRIVRVTKRGEDGAPTPTSTPDTESKRTES